MQNRETNFGARSRIMILTYVTWLTLSLAPAMVAPPERANAQGQPELQQAMDNMVSHKKVVTKRVKDATEYKAVLSSKTTELLEEAGKILTSLPNSNDKQWIESFVKRMSAIAAMLDKTAEKKILPNNLNTVNGTPVPEVLLQPTWPATPAVPGISPFQKTNRMISKFPVTSPELSKVLPANEPSDRQAVTKPAVLSSTKVDEEDELVRELENLHKEITPEVSSQDSKIFDLTPVFTTPSAPLSEKVSTAKTTEVEDEMAKVKAKLIQEIAEFQRLGGAVPKEVIAAFHADKQEAGDVASNQNKSIEDAMKFTEAGMVDRQGIQRFSDVNEEDKEISKINVQNSIQEQNIPYEEKKNFPQLKSNQSFQNFPPNFHANGQVYPRQFGNHFNYMPFQYKFPYQRVQYGIRDQGQYRGIAIPPYQQPGNIPDALKQMMPRPHIYNGYYPAGYNQYLMRHGYRPYPYFHNGNPNNFTNHMPQMMPSYFPNQPVVNHQIDTQLSDEMKRQLRDGKIIVLSDSVVHSNFEANNHETTTENTPEKPKSESNEKNITVTGN